MAKSPFLKFGNAIIHIEMATGALVEDPETGNVRPGRVNVSFQALLKSKAIKDDIKVVGLPGIDAGSVYVEGFLIGKIVNGIVQPIETAVWPMGVKPPLEVRAVIDGREGRLQVLPAVVSPYGVEKRTGQKIFGFFSHRKGA